MKEVYKSKNITVHDDRELLTKEQAFDLLWNGKTLRISYPPDFGEEEEYVFDAGHLIDITDILTREELESQSKNDSQKSVYSYLIGYEISL